MEKEDERQVTLDLTLKMTSAQVVEASVTTTDNSPSQDYTHQDDPTTLLHVTPRFKPCTIVQRIYILMLEFDKRRNTILTLE